MTFQTPTSRTIASGGHVGAEWEEFWKSRRVALGIETSSSTSSASSRLSIRNDSGEVVWQLTGKAIEHLRGLQAQRAQTGAAIPPGLAPCTAQCVEVCTSKASEP